MVDQRKPEVLECVTKKARHPHRHAYTYLAYTVQTAITQGPNDTKAHLISPTQQSAKKQAKARQRRRRTAQERLAHDRRHAQQVAEALQQALDALGLPGDLAAEVEGRLRSQHKLLGKIFGVMFPPLFGCRTNPELCRVRGWEKICPRVCSARSRSGPGSSDSGVWAWRCWFLGCDYARTRFTMSPTAEQLTWPAQASRICRTLMPVVPANASIRDTRCAGVAGRPSRFPRGRTAPILRGGSGNPAAVVSIHALAVVSIHVAQRAHFVQIIGAN
jgi:hypothetical protein